MKRRLKPKHPADRGAGTSPQRHQCGCTASLRIRVSDANPLLHLSQAVFAVFTAVGLWDFQTAMMMTGASWLAASRARVKTDIKHVLGRSCDHKPTPTLNTQ